MIHSVKYLVFRGQTIPRIKYTPEEIETWGKVFNELKRIHDRYASAEYKQNFRELEKEAGYRSFIFRVHFFKKKEFDLIKFTKIQNLFSLLV